MEEEIQKKFWQNLPEQIKTDLAKVKSMEDLQVLELAYFGRKQGAVSLNMQKLKDVSKEKKAEMGKLANIAKQQAEAFLNKKLEDFENKNLESALASGFFDTTIPGDAREIGSIHPLSQVQEEVERIFSQMGFSIMDGPEIESEYYNFEGLNIPKDHPARDMQDTFFIKEKEHKDYGRMVLRTHTSPVQIRTMEKYGAPLRIIVPGRVFRYEATDASHDAMFYQVEGLLIDKEISLSHLKGVMAEFLTRLFGKPVKVRFRPGYFPFVEPGLELDFSCLLCEEKGCRVCKNTGWVEFMGAGMVHKNVLKAGGIDHKKYQGWAFGFGLTRLVMMRYAINDIRLLTNGDIRFVKQF